MDRLPRLPRLAPLRERLHPTISIREAQVPVGSLASCWCVDSEGTELARLRSAEGGWWGFGGYKVFRGDVLVARVPPWGSVSIKPGEGVSTPIAAAFSDGNYTFIQQLRVLARLRDQRKVLRPRTCYDLEIAQDIDIDPVLIVAVCVGIDQVNRAVFTGGGG
jgi:hypothetical protein